jgi:hypothetical protein
MEPETKAVWDVVLTILTMVGGVIAFWRGLLRWRKGQEWQRAAKGRELVDKLLESNDNDEEYYAWDALKMLDYQDASKPFLTKPINLDGNDKRERFPVRRVDIESAIKSSKKDETDPKLLYVRECFDELYFRLGQLQDAIDNDLVEFKHVSCPMDYYVPVLADDVKLHHAYMNRYRYGRTLRFLENFPRWREACNQSKLPFSSEERADSVSA